MKTTVQRWGHSLALRIPKPLAVEIGLSHDAHVDVRLVDGQLIVTPLPRSPYTLEQLLASLTEENQHAAVAPGDVAHSQSTRKRAYVPTRGDLVQLRHSQEDVHDLIACSPAAVLSPSGYNQKTGLVLLCPITEQIRENPFEVPVPPDVAARGVILADQVCALDWHAHAVVCLDRLPGHTVTEVLQKLSTLLSFGDPDNP
jgi:mRNA interferase MazF